MEFSILKSIGNRKSYSAASKKAAAIKGFEKMLNCEKETLNSGEKMKRVKKDRFLNDRLTETSNFMKHKKDAEKLKEPANQAVIMNLSFTEKVKVENVKKEEITEKKENILSKEKEPKKNVKKIIESGSEENIMPGFIKVINMGQKVEDLEKNKTEEKNTKLNKTVIIDLHGGNFTKNEIRSDEGIKTETVKENVKETAKQNSKHVKNISVEDSARMNAVKEMINGFKEQIELKISETVQTPERTRIIGQVNLESAIKIEKSLNSLPVINDTASVSKLAETIAASVKRVFIENPESNREYTINIKIDPPQLGHVEVKSVIKGSEIFLNLSAFGRESYEALQGNADKLRSELSQFFSNVNVSINFGSEKDARQPDLFEKDRVDQMHLKVKPALKIQYNPVIEKNTYLV